MNRSSLKSNLIDLKKEKIKRIQKNGEKIINKRKSISINEIEKDESNALLIYSLSRIPEKCKMYPIEDNYTCSMKLLNCESKSWISKNIIGSKRKGGKTTIRIDGRKLTFKSGNINIEGNKEIMIVLKFLFSMTKEETIFELNKTKKLFSVKRFKQKNKPPLDVVKIDRLKFPYDKTKLIFSFLEEITNNKDKINPSVLIKSFEEKNGKINLNEKCNEIINENTIGMNFLRLVYTTLSVDGENSIKKIKSHIDVMCRMIKFTNDKSMICHSNTLLVTNIVYRIHIPKKFTSNLSHLKSNISFSSYQPRSSYSEKFPGLTCKFRKLTNDHIKTTLSIFNTGKITITGHKNPKTLERVYPYILNFLSTIVMKKDEFIEMIKNGNFDDDYNEDSVNTMNEKLEDEWVKEKESLDNLIHKIGIDGNLIEMMSKKTIPKTPKQKFVEKSLSFYKTNFSIYSNVHSDINLKYDETMKYFSNSLNIKIINKKSLIEMIDTWCTINK